MEVLKIISSFVQTTGSHPWTRKVSPKTVLAFEKKNHVSLYVIRLKSTSKSKQIQQWFVNYVNFFNLPSDLWKHALNDLYNLHFKVVSRQYVLVSLYVCHQQLQWLSQFVGGKATQRAKVLAQQTREIPKNSI